MNKNVLKDAQNFHGAFSRTKKIDFWYFYELKVGSLNAFLLSLDHVLKDPIDKNGCLEKNFWAEKCARMPHILENTSLKKKIKKKLNGARCSNFYTNILNTILSNRKKPDALHLH